jgi:hypothetical protein
MSGIGTVRPWLRARARGSRYAIAGSAAVLCFSVGMLAGVSAAGQDVAHVFRTETQQVTVPATPTTITRTMVRTVTVKDHGPGRGRHYRHGD